jgi:hypothetical protein
VPTNVRLGLGTGDDGDPRLQDTAAHSIPDGAGAAAVMIVAVPAPGGWESIEPGTRQLTATATRATRSQRHLRATIERLDLPLQRQDADPTPLAWCKEPAFVFVVRPLRVIV